MNMLLIIIVFGMFGVLQRVDTYEVADITQAKEIVAAKVVRPVGTYAGEPPSSIPKLYRVQFADKRRTLVDVTDQLDR